MRYKEYVLKIINGIIKMSKGKYSYRRLILEALIKAVKSNMFTQHELRLVVAFGLGDMLNSLDIMLAVHNEDLDTFIKTFKSTMYELYENTDSCNLYIIHLISSVIPTIESKADSSSKQYMGEIEEILGCDECDNTEYLFDIKNKVILSSYIAHICNIIMSKISVMCAIYKYGLDINEYHDVYTKDELIYILTDLIPILLGDIEYDKSILNIGENNIKNFLRSKITLTKGFGTNDILNISKGYKNDINAMTLLN